MDAFEGENKQYRKQLTKLGGNKVLRRRPRAAIFDVSFAIFDRFVDVQPAHAIL